MSIPVITISMAEKFFTAFWYIGTTIEKLWIGLAGTGVDVSWKSGEFLKTVTVTLYAFEWNKTFFLRNAHFEDYSNRSRNPHAHAINCGNVNKGLSKYWASNRGKRSVITIWIEEEYGYREWIAEVSQAQFDESCRLWKTMKNLSCLIPIRMIFPTAERIDLLNDADFERAKSVDHRAHMHESDDSYFSGVPGHEIPDNEGEDFELDGKAYNWSECYRLSEKDRG